MSQRCLFSALAITAGLFTLTGCIASPDGFDAEPLSESEEAIKGGADDTKDTNVVGIVLIPDDSMGGVLLCSGSLIAPNVVLTAQHCVAPVLAANEMLGVQCAKDTFGKPYRPDQFHVSTKQDLFDNPKLSEFHNVRQVLTAEGPIVAAGKPSVCGSDQAILILADLIPPTEAVPLVPRVDEPLVRKEPYYAIGYGASQDPEDMANPTAGKRRRRDTLVVNCVSTTGTESCARSADQPEVASTEWEGQEGICSGDSGGPSLDLKNRVIGVTSRGGQDCTSPVYGYVFGQAKFIKDAAIFAAGLAGYQAPAWATGGASDPAVAAQQEAMLKSNPPMTITSGCSVSRGADVDPSSPISWLAGGALLALTMVRRRRGRAGSSLNRG